MNIKKIALGILQVFVYCIIYEITVWLIYFLGSLLSILPASAFIQGIMYTACPVLSGIIIVFLMGLIFQKTSLFIVPTIIMIAILFFTNISTIISAAYTYGIVSWGFANAAWSSVILSVIVAFGLFSLTRYKISRDK